MALGIIEQFEKVIPRSRLSSRPEDLVCHSCDASRQKAKPDLVAWPVRPGEVAGILRIADRERVPVYPRGAGSGMTGGAVPVAGGIVVDFTRMDRILEIRPDDFVAVVEPGVVVSALQAQAEELRLFYPPDPASKEFATIGGTVAECAGGLRALKYGVTRDYVLALEVALPGGEVIHAGTHALKSVTGYDLTRLFVGSEGTLGLFTKIALRLLPLPPSVITMLAEFADVQDGVKCASSILRKGILPRALELLDEGTLSCVQSYRRFELSNAAGAALLVELDGEESTVRGQSRQVAEICRAEKSVAVREAESVEDRERIWELRRAISPALFRVAPDKLNEDVCVPLSKLGMMFSRLHDIGEKHRVKILNFAHAGDGNVHVNVMIDGSNEEELRRGEAAVREVFEATVEFGGTLSGEHGVGITKSQFLDLEVREKELELMRSLKHIFDPHGILNPGKIFPPGTPSRRP